MDKINLNLNNKLRRKYFKKLTLFCPASLQGRRRPLCHAISKGAAPPPRWHCGPQLRRCRAMQQGVALPSATPFRVAPHIERKLCALS
jgi:hypothetical protein